jgi:hypothetical protein
MYLKIKFLPSEYMPSGIEGRVAVQVPLTAFAANPFSIWHVLENKEDILLRKRSNSPYYTIIGGKMTVEQILRFQTGDIY